MGEDRVRLRAEVDYASGGKEEYWYDVPRSLANELSETGNPWLACLLPLAATLGEPLHLPLPVDPALHANAARLLRIWKTWYPNLFEPAIHCDVVSSPAPQRHDRVGAFFSGGVDSFFTVLRDRGTAPPAERAAIQDLITVWGFDISFDHADAFARLRDRHAVVAQKLGMTLIDVATNLRATRWQEAQWSYLAHGAGLASIALALEKRFGAVYIAGGGGYRGMHPWGSHSVTEACSVARYEDRRGAQDPRQLRNQAADRTHAMVGGPPFVSDGYLIFMIGASILHPERIHGGQAWRRSLSRIFLILFTGG